ncbi:MAG: ATP-binding protein [Bdellovibrionales bacterium]
MSTAAKLIREHQSLLPKNAPVPNRRILVIDDEPEIGAGIRRILCPGAETTATATSRSSRSAPASPLTRPQEFEVHVVTHPDQAVEVVTHALRENRPFAMGFFDVVLGAEIDGIELVKQILSVDPRMFAVFVTAYHDRSVDTIGAFLGEENREKWDYINKPFTEGEILQKARNMSSLWDLHRLKEWQQERLSEAHQLLLQSERQNTAAAVGRSVAHEFGNLLTHIVGNAELALEQNDPSVMKTALEVILKASDTASDILYRFRRLHGSDEAAGASISAFNVWSVLDEAIELLEFQFRKRYIHVRLPKERPEVVLTGNRHAFAQVFVNLFINSMHVLENGGDIHIRVQQSSTDVKIFIRDTGPGIPEDILPRVTEPLFTTKGAEGSGLGLAICREIVEIEHGGKLQLQNHPKGGLEVMLEIPREEEAENEK